MATIGQTLAAARIAAGYTVADLSTRTHIRERVLRGIEEEDFVPCGGDFYARGHIRGLCRALGLDPEPLVEEYGREHADGGKSGFTSSSRPLATELAAARVAATRHRVQEPSDEGGVEDHESTTEAPPPQSFEQNGEFGADPRRRGHFEHPQRMGARIKRPWKKHIPAPRRSEEEHVHAFPDGNGSLAPRPPVTRPRRSEAVRRHWPWALVVVVILLGVFVGVRAWQGEPANPLRIAFDLIRDGEQSADSPTGEDERVTVEAMGKDEGDGEGTEEAAAEESNEVVVGLTAATRSWVQVQDTEGENLFVGFLAEGEAQDYTVEDEVRLWLGDAGAITVSVDGEDIGKAGDNGETKELSVGSEGFGD